MFVFCAVVFCAGLGLFVMCYAVLAWPFLCCGVSFSFYYVPFCDLLFFSLLFCAMLLCSAKCCAILLCSVLLFFPSSFSQSLCEICAGVLCAMRLCFVVFCAELCGAVLLCSSGAFSRGGGLGIAGVLRCRRLTRFPVILGTHDRSNQVV